MQPSVIARIRGNGANANELVILGAHEDSINGGANGRSPGADDDASGSATVLEVFRVLVQNGFRPRRTVEFHAYSGTPLFLFFRLSFLYFFPFLVLFFFSLSCKLNPVLFASQPRKWAFAVHKR